MRYLFSSIRYISKLIKLRAKNKNAFDLSKFSLNITLSFNLQYNSLSYYKMIIIKINVLNIRDIVEYY